jgi:hypothetical protein
MAAAAEAKSDKLDAAATAAQRAGDHITARRLGQAQQEAVRHMLALDELATHYPAQDLAGALYAVALACQAAAELDCHNLDTDDVITRAHRLHRLLLPVVPLLREAAGRAAADLDVARLLPVGTPGARAPGTLGHLLKTAPPDMPLGELARRVREGTA